MEEDFKRKESKTPEAARAERNKQYEGRKAKIGMQSYEDDGRLVEKPFKKCTSDKGPYLRIVTETVDVYKDEEGNDRQIIASEIFGLTEDGAIAENGKLDKFLKKHGCTQPKELARREVVITVGNNGYLSFI